MRQEVNMVGGIMDRAITEGVREPGEEIRSPDGRIAVVSGDLWIGMFNDEGRDREPKVYAGFTVVQDKDGKIVSVKKVTEYGKKSPEYENIRRHYHGRRESPTPWSTYKVPMIVDGRNCQLFTL